MRTILRILISCTKCQECLLWRYEYYSQEQLFGRVAIWSVLLITMQLAQRWYSETYHWGQNGTMCRFAPGFGQNGQIPYFLFFAISQVYDYICLHFVIEYMYWHSLKIPAKYNGYRLDIFTWDQFFLSYAILPGFPYSSLALVPSFVRFTSDH